MCAASITCSGLGKTQLLRRSKTLAAIEHRPEPQRQKCGEEEQRKIEEGVEEEEMFWKIAFAVASMGVMKLINNIGQSVKPNSRANLSVAGGARR